MRFKRRRRYHYFDNPKPVHPPPSIYLNQVVVDGVYFAPDYFARDYFAADYFG